MDRIKFDKRYQKIFEKIDISKAYDMLIDSITGLPTLNFILEEIKTISIKNSVAIIYISIASIANIEKLYGWQIFDNLIANVAEIINKMKGKILRNTDSIAVLFPTSANFIIFISESRQKHQISLENLEQISQRIYFELKSEILKFNSPISNEYINFNIGYSIIDSNENQRVERLLFNALREAEISSINREIKERQKIKEDIKNIIIQEEIRTVFQPIVNLSTLNIMAYEALSRGPQKSKYELPIMLFSAAESHGYSEELEWLCIAKAMINFNLNYEFLNKQIINSNFHHKPMLFLNVDPKTFENTKDIVKKFIDFLLKYNLTSENIVLEITERNAINNFSNFKKIVNQLVEHGFKIAIDDTGAGYSSLQAIAELKPKFLKFDMLLVRDIDKDFVKQELLKTIIDFANKINAIVIAEGIETKAEFETVKLLGAHYGQGYYFSKPSPQLIEMIQII